MSTPPGSETRGASRGHSEHFLEGESPAMSPRIVKLPASVLIVSAYQEHRAFLTELLASDGHRVTQARSATKALDQIKTHEFDLVVTGIRMHGMDGLELLRTVHEKMPNLPVIAIGDANAEMNVVYLRCAELLGVFATYSFPPDPARFLDSARQAIHLHRKKP
jgi:DNA-binding NtrC family response regulator